MWREREVSHQPVMLHIRERGEGKRGSARGADLVEVAGEVGALLSEEDLERPPPIDALGHISLQRSTCAV
eukprot:619645-Rhodomonas_salina.1